MQKTFNRLLLIFYAFLFSSLIYLIVVFSLSRSQWQPLLGPGDLHEIFFWVLFIVCVADLVAVLNINQTESRRRMRERNDSEEAQRRMVSKSILLYALAEVPSILALVHFLLFGNFQQFMALYASSFIAFFVARPRHEI